MIVYSDLYLEPFFKIKYINFIYCENYTIEENENQVIVFLFSDFFKNYDNSNLRVIEKLIKKASVSNKCYLFSDLLNPPPSIKFNATSINSNLSFENFDLSLGSYSQMPFKKNGINKISNVLKKILKYESFGILKLMILDLDNTLIPGVWEEDKSYILKTYSNHQNYIFRSLWRIVKKFSSIGTQIIICSKNDYHSIHEALEFIDPFYENFITHIDSGWGLKSERIKQIITKMNLGADSCLFIDDNDIEIDFVKNKIPNLNVIKFENKMILNDLVNHEYYFFNHSKKADVNRNNFYKRVLKSSIKSDGKIDIDYSFTFHINQPGHFERVCELSVKTNQMNFNKRPIYKSSNEDTIFTITCKTPFSDLGIIGYSIYKNKERILENFVMSCRALGFGLEEKFFNKIIDSSPIDHIRFKISQKNNVAKVFYKKILSNGLQKF